MSIVNDFWVASVGEVYFPAQDGASGYVLLYDSDGKHKDTVRLDVPIRPNQFVAFGSGDLLIAGREPVIPGSTNRNIQ